MPTVDDQPEGDQKGGVMWHTQGSGKSLSMVFFTGKIVLALDNPTVLVITDRNDLDDQLFDTFAASTQLLRQEPYRQGSGAPKNIAQSRLGWGCIHDHTKVLSGRGNLYEELSDRKNIIVIADEATARSMAFMRKRSMTWMQR